jgi:hypothetical protein
MKRTFSTYPFVYSVKCLLLIQFCFWYMSSITVFYSHRTPLHLAARLNATEVAQLLLSKNADVNSRDAKYHCDEMQHHMLLLKRSKNTSLCQPFLRVLLLILQLHHPF